MAKKMTPNQLLTRYALTGGGLGLYFGMFFRPMRESSLWEPNFSTVLMLTGLVTVVTVAVAAWQKRPFPLNQLLKTAVSTFVKTFIFLVLLELRYPLYIWGGNVAVTLFMTAMGALAGLGYAYEKSRTMRNS